MKSEMGERLHERCWEFGKKGCHVGYAGLRERDLVPVVAFGDVFCFVSYHLHLEFDSVSNEDPEDYEAGRIHSRLNQVEREHLWSSYRDRRPSIAAAMVEVLSANQEGEMRDNPSDILNSFGSGQLVGHAGST